MGSPEIKNAYQVETHESFFDHCTFLNALKMYPNLVENVTATCTNCFFLYIYIIVNPQNSFRESIFTVAHAKTHG